MPYPLSPDVRGHDGLQKLSHEVLVKAHDIIAATGQNARSMADIGDLLLEMANRGVIDDLNAKRPGERTATMEVIAEHADGSTLSFYALDGWEAAPVQHVHWHNYWQSMVVVRGTWTDTIWRPVADIAEGVARDVAVARRDVLSAGAIQFLAPTEPHGWSAAEAPRADGVRLLMWSASAAGKPRMDLDIETGRVAEHYGFLNPLPAPLD